MGNLQTRSHATSPALIICSANWSSFENSPEATEPRLVIIAPVKVATSITLAGLYLSMYVKASHKTRRPSASVLRISTVCPDIVLMMSPGRVAFPEGIFSAAARTPMTLMGSSCSAMQLRVPRTLAAPLMSYIISGIEGGGLRLIPPVSNVIPFPTRTWGCFVFLAPW